MKNSLIFIIALLSSASAAIGAMSSEEAVDVAELGRCIDNARQLA